MTARAMAKISPSRLIDDHLGQAIRARRKALGLSQTALGERLGLSFQQIQKYERGANRISASALYRLSEVLQCPLVAFFEGLPQAMGAAVDDPLSELGRMLLEADNGFELAGLYLALRPDYRKALLATGRALSQS
jgi:transcriptional regulator with XRE-family HTH domain